MATTPTQLRLTDSDRMKISKIQERYGLPSMAAAVRYAVETVHREIVRQPQPRARKSGKSAGEGLTL